MTDQDSKRWFVLRAVFHKEEKVRDRLRLAGFRCFVPMCYRVVTLNGRKVRRLMPAVTELVFVYATEESINDFKLRCKDTVYWLTKPRGERREKIVIPDKTMDDFIRITQQNERSVTYFHPEEVNLNKGDHVVIHGGAFDGVEGVLLKAKRKSEKQLVVSLPGIVTAVVNIIPEMVEPITRKDTKSIHPTRDVKELIRLSTQMMTSPPSRTEQTVEWDMLYFEIRRLYEGLIPLHAYLPNLEGEMALSLLMAEKVLEDTVSVETRQRFLTVLQGLNDNTLTSVRMQLIGGLLLPDHDLLNKARHTLAIWKAAPTERQREILEETDLFCMIFNFF